MKKRFYPLLFACIFACVAVCSPHAQGQKASPTKPAWDYKIFTYVSGAIRGGEIPPDEFYEDGNKLALSPTGPLPRLKELGDEGWELVQVVTLNVDWARWQTKYYLKRMK